MDETTREEINEMKKQIAALERTADRQADLIDRIDEHLSNTDKYVWDSIKELRIFAKESIDDLREYSEAQIKELRGLLQGQGLRLALIYGGISVIIGAVGVLVAMSTLLNNMQKLLGK